MTRIESATLSRFPRALNDNRGVPIETREGLRDETRRVPIDTREGRPPRVFVSTMDHGLDIALARELLLDPRDSASFTKNERLAGAAEGKLCLPG